MSIYGKSITESFREDLFKIFLLSDIAWRAHKELMNLHPDKVLLLKPRSGK